MSFAKSRFSGSPPVFVLKRESTRDSPTNLFPDCRTPSLHWVRVGVAQTGGRLPASGGKVRSIFAEPGEGGRIFKRGFSLKKGEQVLIVDDILTTGGSINEVIQLVEKNEGNILGIGVLLDRSGGNVKLDYPLKALAVTDVTNYRPEECPLCKKNEPLIKPGSRK